MDFDLRGLVCDNVPLHIKRSSGEDAAGRRETWSSALNTNHFFSFWYISVLTSA